MNKIILCALILVGFAMAGARVSSLPSIKSDNFSNLSDKTALEYCCSHLRAVCLHKQITGFIRYTRST